MKNALFLIFLLSLISCGQSGKLDEAMNEFQRILSQVEEVSGECIKEFGYVRDNSEILALLQSSKEKLSLIEKDLSQFQSRYKLTDPDVVTLLNSTSEIRNQVIEKIEELAKTKSANTLKFIDVQTVGENTEFAALLQAADELDAVLVSLKSGIMFR